MSSFSQKPLSEISTIFSGYAFKSKDMNADGDIPVIKIANIQNRLVTPNCVTSVPQKLYNEKLEKYILRADDVLIAMTGAGSVGNIGKMRRVEKTFLVNQRVGIIRINTDLADPEFVYQVLSNEDVENKYYQLGLGAGQPNLSPQMIGGLKIPLPPLPIQRKIADVLSAYDDLIEVNTRRIRILERMAQSVYREWFGKVDAKSLPERWKNVKVADAFEIVGGSTPSTKVPEYWEGGDINWYSPSDLTANKAMYIRASGKKITQEGLKNSSAKMFPPYCVMMTSRATIGVVSINTTTACTNQGFITCIPNNQVSLYQIYFWILDNLDLIDNVASGATYKEIGRGEFREFDFVICDETMKQRFDEIISPIGRQIEILLAKNANLRRTRDLLLPRLVSGEVGVPAVHE